ncbi:MAG: hypothetical protein ABI895_34440 [Deltaproteobacteria bacterium]
MKETPIPMNTTMMMLAALITSVGCVDGDVSSKARTASAEQPLLAPAAASSSDEICRSFMQRQRACSEAFIPALVAARVQHDIPAGIAAQDGKIGRPALVREAFEEWRQDSQDAAIGALCDDIAQSLSPARDVELRTSLSACLGTAGCEPFVTCSVPLNLMRWKE